MVGVSVTNLKGGLLIDVDGTVFSVLEYQHHKPGKGVTVVRTRLRNVKQGTVVDKTFKASEKVELAVVDKKMVQYQYRSGDDFHFMDLDTFEDIVLPKAALGDKVNYLLENMEMEVWFHNGQPIGIEIQNSVDLTVTDCPPAFKGNTAAGNTKPATLETGLVVQVPYFIEIGEKIRVDTRTGEYIERVKG